jgi:hypothetical protein
MKVKASITLSDETLKSIDLYTGEYRSRSESIETTERNLVIQLARKKAAQRDFEIINRNAAALNFARRFTPLTGACQPRP